jgi:hypothetical protein
LGGFKNGRTLRFIKCAYLRPSAGNRDLPPLRQALGVALGQASGADAILNGRKIVLHPVAGPQLLFGLVDGKGSSVIVIPRLADRARVENAAAVQFDLFIFPHNAPFHPIILVHQVAQGDVGMADEGVIGLKRGKVDGGGVGVQQVFPDRVARAAVRQGHAIDFLLFR